MSDYSAARMAQVINDDLGKIFDFKSHRFTDDVASGYHPFASTQLEACQPQASSPLETKSTFTRNSFDLIDYHDPQSLMDIAYGTETPRSPTWKRQGPHRNMESNIITYGDKVVPSQEIDILGGHIDVIESSILGFLNQATDTTTTAPSSNSRRTSATSSTLSTSYTSSRSWSGISPNSRRASGGSISPCSQNSGSSSSSPVQMGGEDSCGLYTSARGNSLDNSIASQRATPKGTRASDNMIIYEGVKMLDAKKGTQASDNVIIYEYEVDAKKGTRASDNAITYEGLKTTLDTLNGMRGGDETVIRVGLKQNTSRGTRASDYVTVDAMHAGFRQATATKERTPADIEAHKETRRQSELDEDARRPREGDNNKTRRPSETDYESRRPSQVDAETRGRREEDKNKTRGGDSQTPRQSEFDQETTKRRNLTIEETGRRNLTIEESPRSKVVDEMVCSCGMRQQCTCTRSLSLMCGYAQSQVLKASSWRLTDQVEL